jgi:glycosyltransferase involved in cell wall biosynthesis
MMRQIEEIVIIGILMATYNGEKYLEEQIESIIRQTYENWELWIRDDGSSDKTVEIIKAYAAKDIRINFIDSEGKNLGVLGNFTKLLSLQHSCKYFMFCDQDDIWIPQKIELSLIALNQQEKTYGENLPILVHTDLSMINCKGKTLDKSFFSNQRIYRSHSNPLHELIVENYVTGCTVLFNRPLLEVAMPLPKRAIMHDWWFALIAASTGKLVTLKEITVKYRQHDNNVVGAGKSNTFGLLLGWINLRSQLSSRIEQLNCLKVHLKSLSIKSNYDFVCASHKKIKAGGLLSTIWLIQKSIRLQNKGRTLSFYLLVLIKSL